jgi:dTDP-4-dehydrorhamnose 3,5-epimerase
MHVERLAIADLLLVTPRRFNDPRGFFSETFNAARFAEIGIPGPFVQDNQSLSHAAGVVRGLHCQIGAAAQGKLIRCVRGAIWDVAVDIRQGSPTYGRHCGVELSADNWRQLWIPVGFLHGFCTLQPASEVVYKVTAPYDPASERGVLWNDPDLALPWPVAPDQALLSDKDLALAALADAAGWFPAELSTR